MRIAGILQPGTVLNYVLEAKHIKAGLIVVQTIEERDRVCNENKNSLVNGTPIYVAGTHKTYRYYQEEDKFIPDLSFKEDENGVLCIEGEDGELKKIKVEVGIDDLDPSLKEDIKNLPTMKQIETLISNELQDYVTLSSLNKILSEINSKLAEKQDTITVSGNGLLTINEGVFGVDTNTYATSSDVESSISTAIEDLGALTAVPQATVEALGGIKLGHVQTATERAVVLDGEGKAYVSIPPAAIGTGAVTNDMLAGAITDSKIQSVNVQKLEQSPGEILILDAGDAQ